MTSRSDVAIGLSYTAAALLVFSGTGGRRIGWLLLGIGCCGAGAALSSAVLVAHTGSSPLVRVAEIGRELDLGGRLRPPR